MSHELSAQAALEKFNIKTTRSLKNILRRLKHSALYEDKISIKELNDAINNIVGKVSYYQLPSSLTEALNQQYQDLQNLRNLKAVVKDYNISYRAMVKYIKSQPGYIDRLLMDGILRSNIFNSPKDIYVVSQKEQKLINYYLINLAQKSTISSIFVKTKYGMRVFHRLEEVQDTNWKKGRVIGFAPNNHQKVMPIVALYKGSVLFMENILKNPVDKNDKNNTPFDSSHAPVEFVFKLEDVCNKEYRTLFNRLITILDKKDYSVRVEESLNQKYEPSLRFYIISSGFVSDLRDFDPGYAQLKQDQKTRENIFGTESNQAFANFIKAHNTNGAEIFVTNNGQPKLHVRNRGAHFDLFLPTDIADSIRNAEAKYGVSFTTMLSNMINSCKIYFRTDDVKVIMEQMFELLSTIEDITDELEDRYKQINDQHDALHKFIFDAFADYHKKQKDIK